MILIHPHDSWFSSSHSISPSTLSNKPPTIMRWDVERRALHFKNAQYQLNSDINKLMVQVIRCWLDFLGVVGETPTRLNWGETIVARRKRAQKEWLRLYLHVVFPPVRGYRVIVDVFLLSRALEYNGRCTLTMLHKVYIFLYSFTVD